MKAMGYTTSAVAGFSWQTLQKLVTAGVTIGKIFFLARLLKPDDFGLFSLTAIALGVTESMTETGINLTILQAKKGVEHFVDTAWIIAICRGFLITLVMLAIGWGMQEFFGNPALWPLILVASLIPIVKGFINPAIVSWHKDMEFAKESFYKFSLVFIEAVASVLLAFWLHSVWALIFGMLIAALFEVALSFMVLKLRPKLKYSATAAGVIFHNARWLSVATAFHYLNENVDNLLLGKLVGTYNLGLYQNAYALGHKVNYEVTKSIHHGTIPVYTRIADNLTRLQSAVLRSLGATAVIVTLGSLPLLVAPELVVYYLLGPNWLEAAPLVRTLTVAGLIQSFSSVGYTLFLAKKSYTVMNFHLIVTFIATVTFIWTGFHRGGFTQAVQGIVWARLLTLPIIIWGILNTLELWTQPKVAKK